MASKTQDQRLAFEALVRANAVSYSIQLFLGRGQFERAEADTLAEAISIGTAMKAAHPTCHAQPIYYAIEPSGHSTTITPAQFTESTNMIKTAVTTESAAANVVNAEAIKRAKNAERMRTARAALKACKAGDRHIDMCAANPDNAPAPVEPTVEAKIEQVAEALGVEAPAEVVEYLTPTPADIAFYGATLPPEPIKSGLCPTRGEALVEGRKVYGATAMVGDEFTVTKTARGEWFWGPVDAAKKPTPARGARKAAKADRATKAAKPTPAPKAASGKRADVLAAAERGILPTAPDFTADTHKRFRPALAEVVALVEAGNLAGLKANKIEPLSSSRAAICRYRDLAIVALKAKAR